MSSYRSSCEVSCKMYCGDFSKKNSIQFNLFSIDKTNKYTHKNKMEEVQCKSDLIITHATNYSPNPSHSITHHNSIHYSQCKPSSIQPTTDFTTHSTTHPWTILTYIQLTDIPNYLVQWHVWHRFSLKSSTMFHKLSYNCKAYIIRKKKKH